MQTLRSQLVLAAERLDPQLEIVFKPMFGGACAYLNGRVFASLSDVGLALKLALDAQDDLLKIEGAQRLQYEANLPVSKTYIVVPPAICADETAFATWIGRSLD